MEVRCKENSAAVLDIHILAGDLHSVLGDEFQISRRLHVRVGVQGGGTGELHAITDAEAAEDFIVGAGIFHRIVTAADTGFPVMAGDQELRLTKLDGRCCAALALGDGLDHIDLPFGIPCADHIQGVANVGIFNSDQTVVPSGGVDEAVTGLNDTVAAVDVNALIVLGNGVDTGGSYQLCFGGSGIGDQSHGLLIGGADLGNGFLGVVVVAQLLRFLHNALQHGPCGSGVIGGSGGELNHTVRVVGYVAGDGGATPLLGSDLQTAVGADLRDLKHGEPIHDPAVGGSSLRGVDVLGSVGNIQTGSRIVAGVVDLGNGALGHIGQNAVAVDVRGGQGVVFEVHAAAVGLQTGGVGGVTLNGIDTATGGIEADADMGNAAGVLEEHWLQLISFQMYL